VDAERDCQRGALGAAEAVVTPAVSVVMTAYNREQYIAQSIESVLAQTFGDFELIVVDDRSADRTVEVAERYRSDPRVRIVRNDRNLGDYPNRNHAATFARGEFLKYHDSDDVMYPDCLAVMAGALGGAPSAAFALTAPHTWAGGPCPMLLTPRLAYERAFLGQGLFHLGPACALFRRRAFVDLGKFPEQGVHSDALFWIRACRTVDLVLVRADLFWYRVHTGQELAKPGIEDAALEIEAAQWRALFDDDCPLPPPIRNQARRNHAYGIFSRAIRDVRSGRPAFALRRLRRSGLTPPQWLTYLRRPVRNPNAGTPSAALVARAT
jgi:glycosyltransferase involved in cell wall biosynthesis